MILFFYDKNDESVSSISNIDKKYIFISELKERITDGHAFELAKYLKDKNLDSDDEKLYLEHIDPIIFLGAKRYLAQWKMEEQQEKAK